MHASDPTDAVDPSDPPPVPTDATGAATELAGAEVEVGHHRVLVVRYRAGSCPGRHLACRADAVRRVLDRHPRVEAVLVVPTVGGGDWRALLSRVTARIGDEVVAAVVEEVVVVSVVPMTDALKEVDARELIVASVDRSTIGVTVGPALLGRGVLRALAESAGPDATVELVDTAAHGRALTVW